MSNQIPADHHQRQLILTCFDKNLFVEAGAGAGKTKSLVDRLLNQLQFTNVKAEQLVVITFTKKAANELAVRFHHRLKEAVRKQPENKALSDALATIDRMFIGTIHSFCEKLLRQRPIESGLGLDFEALDEDAEQELKMSWWRTYIHHNDRYQVSQELRELELEPAKLVGTFAELANYSDVDIHIPGLPASQSLSLFIADWRAKIGYFCRNVMQDYQSLVYKDLLNELQEVSSYEGQQAEIPFPALVKFTQWMVEECEKGGGKCALKSKPIPPQGKQQAFEQLVQPVAIAVADYYQQLLQLRHHKVLTLMKEAVAAFQDSKKQRGVIGFQDMLIRTREMLAGDSHVCDYFQQRYRSFCVDEFQDTDPIQAEILFYLTAPASASTAWQNLQPRQGSLFVVGDPKQSIYRFRRADISIYEWVKQAVVRGGGESISLSVNFRSVPAVIDWVNETFGHQQTGLMADVIPAPAASSTTTPPSVNPYQPDYLKMDVWTQPEAGVRTGVFCRVADKPETDAVQMAEQIATMIESKEYKASDFMIITDRTTHSEKYLIELVRRSIPVQFTGKFKLGQVPEVRKLLYMMHVIATPSDEIRTAAALVHVYGVHYKQLFAYKKRMPAGHRLTALHSPDETDKSTVATALRGLQTLLSLKFKLATPVAVLYELVDQLDLFGDVQVGEQSKTGAVDRLFQFLAVASGQVATRQGEDFASFLQRLESIVQRDFKHQLALHDSLDAVRIMNLHQAKGLEARVVFLAYQGAQKDRVVKSHIVRQGVSAGYFRVTEQKGYHTQVIGDTVAWHPFFQEEQKFADAERIRLLYVAATRAKEMLVITFGDGTKKSCWDEFKPHCKLPFESPADPGTDSVQPAEEAAAEADQSEGSSEQPSVVDVPDSIDRWMAEARKISYADVTPSELDRERRADQGIASDLDDEAVEGARSAGFPRSGSNEPYGRAWGMLVHSVFQWIIEQPESTLDSVIRRAVLTMLREYPLDGRDVSRLLSGQSLALGDERQAVKQLIEIVSPALTRIVNDWRATDWYRRLQRAQVSYAEYPFVMKVTPDEGDLSRHLSTYFKVHRHDVNAAVDAPESLLLVVNGVIDLAFACDGVWTIVDYKTNRKLDGESSQAFKERMIREYRPQLLSYKLILERLTGQPVGELILHPTTDGELPIGWTSGGA